MEEVVECPTASGTHLTLFQVRKEIARRLSSIFLRDSSGHRPLYGGSKKFPEDRHWRDYILFYEYFHGDTGEGLAPASKPAGRRSFPRTRDLFTRISPEDALQIAKDQLSARMIREQVCH